MPLKHAEISFVRLAWTKHYSKAGFLLSFQQVESEDKFERIGGSSIGGGTFWGLGALLTKTKVS